MSVGGDDFDVDLEQLDELVMHMKTFNDHIERTGDEIEERIAGLHHTWTGQGAEAHAGWQERWNQALEELRDGLDQLKAASKTAHANYSSAAAANKRMWPA